MFLNKCSECGGTEMFYDEPRGETTCTDCGMVADSLFFSQEPEWRAYSAEEDGLRIRVEFPGSVLSNREMGTTIGGKRSDSLGKILDSQAQSKFFRLSRRNKRIQYEINGCMKNALMELRRIKSHLAVSEDICKIAVRLYQQAQGQDLIRGRSLIGMISAAAYLACRKKQVSITQKDIAAITGITEKELARSVRVFHKYLKICNEHPNFSGFVNRIGETLRLTMHTRIVAINLLKKAQNRRITSGKSPISMAAAALYLASIQTGERRTQLQIALTAKITTTTIRNRCKEMMRRLGLGSLEIKRGAAGKPVIIKDPIQWVNQKRQLAGI